MSHDRARVGHIRDQADPIIKTLIKFNAMLTSELATPPASAHITTNRHLKLLHKNWQNLKGDLQAFALLIINPNTDEQTISTALNKLNDTF